MAIERNELPLLEFDSDPNAVFMPNHEGFSLQMPEKAVFAFLGETVDRFAKENDAKIIGHFECTTKLFPVYVLNYEGEEIALMQAPLGAPAAAQVMDWMIGYGAKKIISTGCCGVLTDLEENVFLIPNKALRDEGTSFHYLPASRYVDINPDALKAIRQAFERLGLSYQEVLTWTTDGFYRETKAKTLMRKNEGCVTVEMECSALAACAQMRHVLFGQILFTADSLAQLDHHQIRGEGKASHQKAIKLCFEVLREL